MALQSLMENAIKHNRITSKEPLTINIYSKHGNLIVENNYQPRPEESNSMGIGLNNIKERYEMLCDRQPEFYLNETSYFAKIPLIQPA